MAEYAFVSQWRLGAPIEVVWSAIAHPEDWPTWWRYVKRVELLEPGDADGLGALRRHTWRTARAWMDRLAPLALPAFAWKHAVVMRRGGQDLARYIGARLLSAT